MTRPTRPFVLSLGLLTAGLSLAGSASADDYIIGADVSSLAEQEDRGIVFVDTDGVQKDLLTLLKSHGFNFIRLRTFVDPLNDYGYASDDACPGKAKAYNDRDHIVALAQRVKAAGMGLLLDFHYSDTWADPGKQVIPEAWRGAESISELAAFVSDYTVDVMQALKQAGVLPEVVQVGNEITPGMLIHVPTEETDCFGNNSVPHAGPNGSAGDWNGLATLLDAGIEAVKSVHSNARIMLHIENTADFDEVVSWVNKAHGNGLEFDILGLSAYEHWQGPSSQWRQTFTDLATTFPDLELSVVEYGDARQLVNDIMLGLPGGRGMGTFIWEPTLTGPWGEAIFERQGNVLTARADAFAVYDRIARQIENCHQAAQRVKEKLRATQWRGFKAGVPMQPACLSAAVARKCRREDSLPCNS